MKNFLERHDLLVTLAASIVLDIMVMVMAPGRFLALLPILAFQGLLFLIKFRFPETWVSLRKALYFYFIAGTYISYMLVGALLWNDGIPVPALVVYYVITLALFAFELTVRIAIRKTGGELKAPKFVRVVWEWVDAILWSLIMVAVVNTFLLQIYIIPSESMVSTYHVGDRPLVIKILSGPTIPLTSVQLPRINVPKKGDVVVVKNTRPQYDHTLSGEASRFFNDLLFMSTFTLVNLNVDKNGEPLADPLVKRVVASQGDRVTMIDDQVYVQAAEGGEWVKADWAPYKPVTADPRVQVVPVSEKSREDLAAMDQAANAIDVDAWYAATQTRLDAIHARLVSKPLLAKEPSSFDYKNANFHSLDQDGFSAMIAGLVWDLQKIPGRQPITADSAESLAFLLKKPVLYGSEAYWLKCLRTELYLKTTILDMVEALANSTGSAEDNQKITDVLGQWEHRVTLYFVGYIENGRYTNGHFESRNLEPFPLEGRIPADNYLAMGDNRYNSLDNRHFSTTPTERRLVKNHDYSFLFYGINNPYTIKISDILGFPLFKVWPWN